MEEMFENKEKMYNILTKDGRGLTLGKDIILPEDKRGKNQQEYILSCVLEKQIVNTDGIKELIPELKRIGNNLNQIAKRCNEGGVLPSEAEVREQGEELKQVWQLLRRYLQRQA